MTPSNEPSQATSRSDDSTNCQPKIELTFGLILIKDHISRNPILDKHIVSNTYADNMEFFNNLVPKTQMVEMLNAITDRFGTLRVRIFFSFSTHFKVYFV